MPGPPCKGPHHLQIDATLHYPIPGGTALSLIDSAATLGAALIATLLVGRSKGYPLAAHGGGTTATILRVVPLPRLPEMLRAFAPMPTPMWCAEMLRAESTVRLEA